MINFEVDNQPSVLLWKKNNNNSEFPQGVESITFCTLVGHYSTVYIARFQSGKQFFFWYTGSLSIRTGLNKHYPGHQLLWLSGFIQWIIMHSLNNWGQVYMKIEVNSKINWTKTTKPHVRLLQALLIWLMQSKDLLVYKIHYSQEIKIIYHSFLHEPSAM